MKQGTNAWIIGILFSAWAAAGSPLFTVAPEGSDANGGTEAAPFATLGKARDALRAWRQGRALPAGGAVIELRGGTYTLDGPFELGREDGGATNAPVVYRGRVGEEVRLSGGRIVKGWRKVDDPATLARLDETARGRVWVTDLKEQGVTDYGAIKADDSWSSSVPGIELFYDDRSTTLARWPNDSAVKIEKICEETNLTVNGSLMRGSRVGKFVYGGDRPKHWAGEPDLMLEGYWFWDWASQRLRVASLDTVNRVIALEPKPVHAFGFRKGQWYYAYNILAELDRAGEWYLDRAAGKLYFWPPAGDPNRGRAVVTLAPGLLQMKGADNIVFTGMTFENCRGTAIRIDGGSECVVSNCVIRNLGANGADITGGRNRLIDCEIYGAGCFGVSLNGGDRASLMPAGNAVERCDIHHIGRWKAVYSAAVAVYGVGNRVSRCHIHDSPHMAIVFGGNEHVIEGNEMNDVVLNSNDAGAIYAGRNFTYRGNVIRNNFLHDINGYEGRGCHGIYLDDQYSSATILNNIFLRVADGVFIGGGRDNLVRDNIFVDCPCAFLVDARGLGWAAPGKDGLVAGVKGVPYDREPWASRYPALRDIFKDPVFMAPRGNVIAHNFIQRCARWSVEEKARPGTLLEDNIERK